MNSRRPSVPRTWMRTAVPVALAVAALFPSHGLAGEPTPFDVQAVVRRVHFAFRQEGESFTGGHSTYGVEFSAGRLSVRPVRPRQDPPAAPGAPLRSPHTSSVAGAPLVLETASIRRGSLALPAVNAPAVGRDGRLVRRGPAFEETVENKDDGVEVSWHFPSRPRNQGDLEVRLAASGLEYRGETAGGHHFHDPASGLGVRFGHATWIDADGERTAVSARWDGRAIVIGVPARVVDEAAYPAVLDPLIGPESGLDNPIAGPASGHQSDVSAAYSSTANVFLVVWSDYRGLYSQIFATRVTSSGTVADINGILVSASGVFSAENASAVFDGSNFLVVYGSAGDIWGRRISTAGTIVDAAPFAISAHPANQYSPHASSNGTTTLVVWNDDRDWGTSGSDIYGARVTGATVLDDDDIGFAISTATNNQWFPRVSSGADRWLVVWEDQRSGADDDIYGARVSGVTGSVEDPAGIAISIATADQARPWTASNGVDHFVVWHDTRNAATASADIYGARVVGATGVLVDTAGIRLCDNPFAQSFPSVAYASGASHYQVVWFDGRYFGLFGNRVDILSGTLLDGNAGAVIGGSSDANFQWPRIFGAGSGYFVGWVRFSSDSYEADVWGSRILTTPTLVDVPGIELARSANGQRQVAVAADSANYLVVWSDDRGGAQAIYGARVSGATGASLDPSGILLSSGGRSEWSPAVAFNGTDYLVVWHDLRPDYGIWGTRVTTAGTVLDPAGLDLFTQAGGNGVAFSAGLDVASDGSGWFVAWEDARSAGPTDNAIDIYGGRVSAAGTALDASGIAISTAPEWQGYPRVAFGGGRYLVVWVDDRGPTTSEPFDQLYEDLYAARVTTAGDVEDVSGIPIAVGPGWVDWDGHAVAYGSPNFIVAFTEGGFVHRARVSSATGMVLDTGALTGADCRAPEIAYDGEGFVVVYGQLSASGLGYDVKGTRIDAAGIDRDAVDWDVAAGGGVTDAGPAMAAAAGGGEVLVAYARYDPTAGVTSARVRARIVTGTDGIFADDFESGDLFAWSSAQTDGGDLTVSATAALAGTGAGAEVLVDDTAGVYVVDETPQDEDRYRARFYFDPSGFDPGESEQHFRTRIFIAFEEGPNRRLAAIVLRRQGGAYSVMGRTRLDDGTQAKTPFVPISAGPHVVEIDWRRASGPDALDGSFQMWIDGAPAGSLSNLDNHLSAVDFVRLGALSVKSGAAGTLHFDEFESRRLTDIGP